VIAESRWPMAAAVVAFALLDSYLPDSLRITPPWVPPVVVAVPLIAMILGDPGKIDRQERWLRIVSVCLVGVLIATAILATVRLTGELINGSRQVSSADSLLRVGAIVWCNNCLAFALLYWELDAGGATARAHQLAAYPDLAFPQHLTPGIAPPEWRPRFGDYLYLGFTNATAFSPTDVMPLTWWAKFAMTVQSLVSLVILGLVIARAVNVLA
jgi:hypothetical protein